MNSFSFTPNKIQQHDNSSSGGRHVLAPQPGRLDAILGLPPVSRPSRSAARDMPPESFRESQATTCFQPTRGGNSQDCSQQSQSQQSQGGFWESQMSADLLSVSQGQSSQSNKVQPVKRSSSARISSVGSSQGSGSNAVAVGRSFEASLAAQSHEEVMRSLAALQTAHKETLELMQTRDNKLTSDLQRTQSDVQRLATSLAERFDDRLALFMTQMQTHISTAVSEAVHTALRAAAPQTDRRVARSFGSPANSPAQQQAPSYRPEHRRPVIQQYHAAHDSFGAEVTAARFGLQASSNGAVQQRVQYSDEDNDECEEDISAYLNRKRNATAVTGMSTSATMARTYDENSRGSGSQHQDNRFKRTRQLYPATVRADTGSLEECAESGTDADEDSLFCSLGYSKTVRRA